MVAARVLAHERGPKLRVVKFKPKRGYKRRTGHRQELTRLEVTEITVAGLAAAGGAAEFAPPGEVGTPPAGGAVEPAPGEAAQFAPGGEGGTAPAGGAEMAPAVETGETPDSETYDGA